MRRVFVALIVLAKATKAWYKIVMQGSLGYTIEYHTCHLYFLGIHKKDVVEW